jgi:hypothetical protein
VRPRRVRGIDLDEVRQSTGRKLVPETPGRRSSILAAYLPADDGPVDLNEGRLDPADDSDEVPRLRDAVHAARLDPPQPRAFRQWPTDDAAARSAASSS